MDLLNPLILTHAAATLLMTGLIWFVQIVHYPLMKSIGAAEFVAYEKKHVRRVSFVVGPLMLLEAISAAALPFVLDGAAARVAGGGLVLLFVIWASTILLQVPLHRRLERGFDAVIVDRLVATNWIRTVAWSGRGLIALLLLAMERSS